MLHKIFIFCSVLVGIGLSNKSPAATDYEDKYRENVFHIGLSGHQFALSGDDGVGVIGNSSVISLGGGIISENYFSLLSVSFILGPYQPLDDRLARLDYTGTGFRNLWGWTWNRQGLRAKSGTIGLIGGMQYVDVVGRSVGTRFVEQGTVRDLVNQIYDFSFVAGLFYAKLKDPTPKSNDPKHLATRLDGFIIHLGVAFPLQSEYTQEYTETLSGSDSIKKKSKGQLDGRTYLISLIAPLGV